MIKIVHGTQSRSRIYINGVATGNLVRYPSKWEWYPVASAHSHISYPVHSIENLEELIKADISGLEYQVGEKLDFSDWIYECPGCRMKHLYRPNKSIKFCNQPGCRFIVLIKTFQVKTSFQDGYRIVLDPRGVASRDLRYAIWVCMKENDMTCASLSLEMGVDAVEIHNFFKLDYEARGYIVEKMCEYFELSIDYYTDTAVMPQMSTY